MLDGREMLLSVEEMKEWPGLADIVSAAIAPRWLGFYSAF